jgi:transposase
MSKGAAADGRENKTISQALGAGQKTVGKWRQRFAERRVDGRYDEPRSGAPRRIGDDEIAETVRCQPTVAKESWRAPAI